MKVYDNPLKSLFASHPPPPTVTPNANRVIFSNEKIMLRSVVGRSLRGPYDLHHSGVSLVIMLLHSKRNSADIVKAANQSTLNTGK